MSVKNAILAAGGGIEYEVYGSEVDVFPPDSPLVCLDKSLTRQSEKDSADINVLLARYDKTGVLPVNPIEGLYLDVSQMQDYRESLDQVNLAGEFFKALPAKIRADFDNDPSQFLDFAVVPENRPKLEEYGLVATARPPAEETPPATPPRPPATA